MLQIPGNLSKMELECTKYMETMAAEKARCNHPDDYCKYRSSCIIHFVSKGKKDLTPPSRSSRDGSETDETSGSEHD